MQGFCRYAKPATLHFMIKIFNSIFDIDSGIQNSCLLPQALGSWNYYVALEKSKSLSVEQGWTAQYATYFAGNKCVGFIPMFSKIHSGDDFVYDQPIAIAFESEKKAYYPKLQIGIPFMPMQGSKFYIEKSFESHINDFLAEVMEWAKKQSVSSLHIALPSSEDFDLIQKLGFIPSTQALCYWTNHSFRTFSDFLDTLKSKYRSQINQERKAIQENGYQYFAITGKCITAKHIDTFYEIFQTTHDRKGWVRSKLTKEFFHEFSKSNPEHVVYMFLQKNGETIATSCHFLERNMLCGRFWGSTSDDHFLHFEIMYYLPMQYCIQHKIPMMEIGFEKPHKIIRGFVPQLVKSFHLFFDSSCTEKAQSLIQPKILPDKNIFR